MAITDAAGTTSTPIDVAPAALPAPIVAPYAELSDRELLELVAAQQAQVLQLLGTLAQAAQELPAMLSNGGGVMGLLSSLMG